MYVCIILKALVIRNDISYYELPQIVKIMAQKAIKPQIERVNTVLVLCKLKILLIYTYKNYVCTYHVI